MAYHFKHTQLRILRKFAKQERNSTYLSNARLIILEHILPTTEEFINILHECGAEVFAILSKPYSINKEIHARLSARFEVLDYSYDILEGSNIIPDILSKAVDKSMVDGKEILIVDVGGYFAKPLSNFDHEKLKFISGVIEDTTFGYNRYCEIVSKINTPVFSVARSSLKEIEARFVGRDSVHAMDMILRNVGITISGRTALVIGYGMIGSNVARALRANDLNVCVYDKHDNRNLKAFMDGFHIHKKRELLKTADIIFLATGDPKGALTFEEIEECRDNVILVSVGSKNTEYDLSSLEVQSVSCEKLDDLIVLYTLNNSNHVISIKKGTAVNFAIPSIPVEVLDLVFSEILLSMMLLLKKKEDYPPGSVHELPITFLNEVAKEWLRFVNKKS